MLEFVRHNTAHKKEGKLLALLFSNWLELRCAYESDPGARVEKDIERLFKTDHAHHRVKAAKRIIDGGDIRARRCNHAVWHDGTSIRIKADATVEHPRRVHLNDRQKRGRAAVIERLVGIESIGELRHCFAPCCSTELSQSRETVVCSPIIAASGFLSRGKAKEIRALGPWRFGRDAADFPHHGMDRGHFYSRIFESAYPSLVFVPLSAAWLSNPLLAESSFTTMAQGAAVFRARRAALSLRAAKRGGQGARAV